jgi:hypothetical protein
VLFFVSPHLLGLQVVVEVAKQEQGAIEPLLLLGSEIEAIFEGREHVLTRRMVSHLVAHEAHPSPCSPSTVNGVVSSEKPINNIQRS